MNNQSQNEKTISETHLLKMLRNLPISITIVPRDNTYAWFCFEGSGEAETVIDALENALLYLLRTSQIRIDLADQPADLPEWVQDDQQEQEHAPDWKAIEEQAKQDLEAIQTDQDAIAFIQKYFAKDLQPDYLKLYRSDRHEMGRSPKKAIENLLSLPPIQ